mmetsp:Transcript_65094/g.153175  ORF Transcript_65094/g.153175 Transcript_65094/m.153175 type:complete len:208 (+) Transcript_65094:487-1110(+)
MDCHPRRPQVMASETVLVEHLQFDVMVRGLHRKLELIRIPNWLASLTNVRRAEALLPHGHLDVRVDGGVNPRQEVLALDALSLQDADLQHALSGHVDCHQRVVVEIGPVIMAAQPSGSNIRDIERGHEAPSQRDCQGLMCFCLLVGDSRGCQLSDPSISFNVLENQIRPPAFVHIASENQDLLVAAQLAPSLERLEEAGHFRAVRLR